MVFGRIEKKESISGFSLRTASLKPLAFVAFIELWLDSIFFNCPIVIYFFHPIIIEVGDF
jgi:hypothetical protein